MNRIFLGSMLIAAAAMPWADACTVFTISTPTTRLLANNEDFTKRGALSFVPGSNGKYGRVNVGFQNSLGIVETFAQGGMNEKGLAFDAMVVGNVPWEPDANKPTRENLPDDALNKCTTVAEVITLFRTYDCAYLAGAQFMFADASGESAVIGWEPERGLTVVKGDGSFQVATNTRIASSGYRCPRAMRVSQLLTAADSLDVRAARTALEAVHQRGPAAFTSYSCVYDLMLKKIYLYNLTNFDEVVELDLAAELAKGLSRRPMSGLFQHSPSLDQVRAGQQRTDYQTRIQLDREQLHRFAGVYVPDPAPEVRTRIETTDDGLRVQTLGQPTATLFPEAETVFRIAPDRGQVTFQLSDSGAVTGLTLHKGRDVVAKRVSGE